MHFHTRTASQGSPQGLNQTVPSVDASGFEPDARRRTLILINACVMTFMATLDGSIVNIALPTIAESFKIGISTVQWVTTSYLIVISALLLLWGRLSDIFGRKRFFAAGVFLFALGSLLCGFANNIALLVGARIVQAIGGSMAIALVQGIVTSTFPPNERGKALGFVGAVVSVGSLLGPSLGGFLVQLAGWRSIFFINVPVGLFGVILTMVNMPESRGRSAPARFNTGSAALFSSAIVAFFIGMLALQQGMFSIGISLGIVTVGLALFFAFVRAERGVEPLVDLTLMKNKVFVIGVTISCLSYMALFSYTFFMPFFLQNAKGMSVLQAGALMSLYPLVTAVLAPVAGALSDRITYRPLTVGGLIVNALALAMLALLVPSSSVTLIGGIIVLLGIGGAAFQSPNNSSVMGAAPRDRLGIAGSLSAFFRNLGMVAGTTLAVSLFTFSTKVHVENISAGSLDVALFLRGFRVVVLVAAALSLAGMVLELRGRPRKEFRAS